MKRDKHISEAVIRRLPRYYRHLDNLHYDGITRISSQKLADVLGCTASQIRQDLSCFGEFGQQGYGYNVSRLRAEIASILGMDRGRHCVVVGMGNLGRALVRNFPFSANGFILDAGFDLIEDQEGKNTFGLPVYPAEDLERHLARLKPDVAVLVTPRSVASQMANRLVTAGIKGIWNFTNIELNIDEPEKVILENVHFADSLLSLSYRITAEELKK